jgi:hypothetical protein
VRVTEEARFIVELDEKLQIIRNRIFCGLDDELAVQITEAMIAAKSRMKDPDKVRALVFFNLASKGTTKGRKILMDNLKRPDFYKMAVLGNNPYMAALATFFFVATGINKVKLFSDESDAIRWLNE